MRLSRMEITNHSRIQDLDLAVRRHAVIVGANDVGKLSILRMLNLLLGTSTAGLYPTLKPGDVRNQEQPLVVNAWWSGFTDDSRRLFPSEISIAGDCLRRSGDHVHPTVLLPWRRTSSTLPRSSRTTWSSTSCSACATAPTAKPSQQ